MFLIHQFAMICRENEKSAALGPVAGMIIHTFVEEFPVAASLG
jgi:hypothetical protein